MPLLAERDRSRQLEVPLIQVTMSNKLILTKENSNDNEYEFSVSLNFDRDEPPTVHKVKRTFRDFLQIESKLASKPATSHLFQDGKSFLDMMSQSVTDSAKDKFGSYLKKMSLFMNTVCCDEAVLRDDDFLAFIKVPIYQ